MTAREQLGAALKAKGVRQPLVVIDEAKRARIFAASALAMLEMETGIPQDNIFGCDHGAGVAFCHEKVTKARVLALRRGSLANGVGWTQLTYPPFVAEADAAGGAHIPRFQMRVGFKVLRDNFDRLGSISEMFRAYNGTGSAASAYAARALALRSKWLTVTNE
jgi:hypothetical protein